MKIKVKHLERWKDRHGKIRLYYREGKGNRFSLRGPEGAPQFWEDYHAAANGMVTEKPSIKRADKSSMRWLVEQYFASSLFRDLGDRTKYVRRGVLERFCAKHGDKPYAKLRPTNLYKITDTMSDRPEAANAITKALRQVYEHAVKAGHVDANPAKEVKLLKSKNKEGFHSWTEGEIKRFEAQHPIGTKARLALALLLFTAQRREDVTLMGPKQVQDELMEITQKKTGAHLKLPMLKELQQIIEATPTGDDTFLVTQFGKPYSSAGFGNWFRRQCDKADLTHCSAHGLRKAAAVRMAEKDCTPHQIKAVTGHQTLKEVDRYTKAASQERLAEQARQKVEGDK